MNNTLGNNIANFKISTKEAWSLLKFAAPLMFIPITIAFAKEHGLLEGVFGGIIVSSTVSVFLSFFLVFMISLFAKTKLYIHGVAAMDSNGNTGAKMKWSDIESVSHSSLLCFKTIKLVDKNENSLVLFKNIKDEDGFVKTVVELAGQDNPLSKFLSIDS